MPTAVSVAVLEDSTAVLGGSTAAAGSFNEALQIRRAAPGQQIHGNVPESAPHAYLSFRGCSRMTLNR